MQIPEKLQPIFTTRFLKFCSAGASGLVVNLVFLMLFADIMKMNINLASALAIEISIISNFFINELWTFSDKRDGSVSLMTRIIRFNVVSFIGAAVQWSCFVCANIFWMYAFGDPDFAANYFSTGAGWFESYILNPVLSPPDVGAFKFLSQIFGIGVATFWNFLVNFYWTWNDKK